MALASVRDKLDEGGTFGGEILQTDACRACVTHGLGLLAIGSSFGRKFTTCGQKPRLRAV